jgi:hypothetical protein
MFFLMLIELTTLFEHYPFFCIFDTWIYKSTAILLFVLLVLEKLNRCTGIMMSLLFHLSCLKGVIHIFISILMLHKVPP